MGGIFTKRGLFALPIFIMDLQNFTYNHLPLYYHGILKPYHDLAKAIKSSTIFNRTQTTSLLTDLHKERQQALALMLKIRISQETS